MIKFIKESFDEMDAAYEVFNILMKKYGKDFTSKQAREESEKYAKTNKGLDPEWIYNFVIEDVSDEYLNESKQLNEDLSPDKEAFLLLDKLAGDLKKIYDQDNFKIYEEEKVNKAVSDLMELEIKYPVIKELVHYVAQSTYERRYDARELMDKMSKMKLKYSNANNSKKSESKKLVTEELRKLIESDLDDYESKVKKLRDMGYLHFTYFGRLNNGETCMLGYINLDNPATDNDEGLSAKEFQKLFDSDVEVLKELNSTIEEIDDESNESKAIVLQY